MKDNNNINEIISHNLKTMLNQRGWSVADLHEELLNYISVNHSSVFRWCSGDVTPADKYLLILSDIFKFPFPLWKDHKISASEVNEIILDGGKRILLDYQDSFAIPNLMMNGTISIISVFHGKKLIGNLPLGGTYRSNCIAFYVESSFIDIIPSGCIVIVAPQESYKEDDIVIVNGGQLGKIGTNNQVHVENKVSDKAIVGRVCKIIIDI